MLRRLNSDPRLVPGLLLGGLWVLYLLTANRDPESLSIDAQAASMAAWNLAETGSWVVHDPPLKAWLQPHPDGGFVVRRQPGVIAAGVPFYLAARPLTDGFSMWPAAVGASSYAVAAVALLALLVRRLGATSRQAAAAAAVAGLATATWSISADGLWTHGPDQVLLLAALNAVAAGRWLWAGAALGAACTVRTHLAVVAAVLGLWAAARLRSAWPTVAIGVPAATGVAVVVAYSAAVFEAPTLNGGYQGSAGDPSAELVRRPIGTMLVNVAGLLVSPDRGLLTTTPVVVPLLLAGLLALRRSPWWAKASAVSGVLYLLIQARLNHWSGGAFFWGSRLTIEVMTLWAPLMWCGWRDHVRPHRDRRAAVLAAAAVSASFHVIGAVVFTPNYPHRFFTHWWIGDLVLLGPHELVVSLVLATGLAAATAVVLLSARRGRAILEPDAAAIPTDGTAAPRREATDEQR